MDHSMTYFTYEYTLSQIGFGYPFLFVLGFYSSQAGWGKRAWAMLALVLVGYWLVWALYPAAPANFDWRNVGVSPEWSGQHDFTGLAKALTEYDDLGNLYH